MEKPKLFSSFAWKILERSGYVGIQFAVQIILARIIAPEQFGVLAVMTCFVNLVQVFSQSGLNSALIQSNEVIDEDYSSVFWVNLTLMSVFYVLIYLIAPVVESFYGFTDFVYPFRVLSLSFFTTALSSVQIAILTKELRFKSIFKCSIIGVCISGIAGISMAYMGYKMWALVIQALLNQGINTFCLCFAVNWRPRFVLSITRIRMLLSYGGKVLAGSLIGEIYNDFCSFIIGKVAAPESLAFFKRGKLFPQMLANIVTSSTKSVMYPIMSVQKDNDLILHTFRQTMRLSSYVVTPMLTGMAAVSESLIVLLLTDKWLSSVPYLQVFCAVYIIYQVHGIYTTALNSKGRSDLTLIVQIVMVGFTLLFCVISLLAFKSTILVAWSTLLVSVITVIPLDAFFCKKVLGYGFTMQIKDISPSLLMSAVMFAAVLTIRLLGMTEFVTLILQIMVGVTIYVIMSIVFKDPSFTLLLTYIKKQKR